MGSGRLRRDPYPCSRIMWLPGDVVGLDWLEEAADMSRLKSPSSLVPSSETLQDRLCFIEVEKPSLGKRSCVHRCSEELLSALRAASASRRSRPICTGGGNGGIGACACGMEDASDGDAGSSLSFRCE